MLDEEDITERQLDAEASILESIRMLADRLIKATASCDANEIETNSRALKHAGETLSMVRKSYNPDRLFIDGSA